MLLCSTFSTQLASILGILALKSFDDLQQLLVFAFQDAVDLHDLVVHLHILVECSGGAGKD